MTINQDYVHILKAIPSLFYISHRRKGRFCNEAHIWGTVLGYKLNYGYEYEIIGKTQKTGPIVVLMTSLFETQYERFTYDEHVARTLCCGEDFQGFQSSLAWIYHFCSNIVSNAILYTSRAGET